MKIPVFKPYPFRVGEKIRVEDSPRSGDWEVVKVTEHKVTLKCPLSQRELTWSRFCYLVDQRDQPWPLESEED